MAAISRLKQHWTIREYLAMEDASDEKHEYVAGMIYNMAGASRKHIRIHVNTSGSLNAQLIGSGCSVYASDLRIRAGERAYVYPDVLVVCGKPEVDPLNQNTVTNPTLIVEVLSPSTEDYDRGSKFASYRELDSLQEYLLINQNTPHVMRYLRQSSGDWLLTDFIAPDAIIELPSIGCRLALADVYADVDFEEEDDL
jgi:Uma2 family endonuclease